MELRKIILLCFIFVLGFSLGYLVSIPKHITIDIQLDDNFVEMTENMKEIEYKEYKSVGDLNYVNKTYEMLKDG